MGDVVPFRITKLHHLAFGQFWRIRECIRRPSLSPRMTSITLESDFWIALEIICDKEKMSLNEALDKIYSAKKKDVSMSSAARIFVMSYLMASIATEQVIKDTFKKIGDRHSYPESRSYNTTFKVIAY